jgi:hypothetical protein
MDKWQKSPGKTRFHELLGRAPIQVHEQTSLVLFWNRADDMDQEDDRGHDTLFCPVGWISDELDHWQLRFSGPPKRPDAQPDDYPFFWSGMEYTDPESRKKNAAFEVVLPVALDPEMPHWSPKETGVLKKSNKTREAPSVRERRVKHKVEAWDLGARSITSIYYPHFRAKRHGEKVVIELEPYSTARMLLRIIEQAMMHIPKTTVKDTPLEPLLKVTEFLSAMDHDNFGKAASLCALRYVKGFALAVPEPHRALILPEFACSAAEEQKRIALDKQMPVTDLSRIRESVAKGPAKSLISIQQIAIDLDNDKHAGGATSPRRLVEKLDRMKIPITHHPALGEALTLEQYRKVRAALLLHGNEKSSR